MKSATRPTALLLHGAFLDGSCWDGVIERLQAEHHAVMAVQVPLSSLSAAVAATRRALARINGPVILVGHSWSGVVITEAGFDPRVNGLVYVAAGAPNVAESFNDLLALSATAMPGVAGIQADAEGFLWYDPAQFQAGLAADVDPARVRRMAAIQQPVAAQAFAEPVTNVAWQTKRSWYALAAGDAILAPDLQQFMARRIDATTVTLAGASHCLMVSQPQAISELVIEAIHSSAR
jgi:pimeloyl-ACP methyl ester carboxylesterase